MAYTQFLHLFQYSIVTHNTINCIDGTAVVCAENKYDCSWIGVATIVINKLNVILFLFLKKH